MGLPRFLLPDGRHSITSSGSLPSSILLTVRTVGVVSFLCLVNAVLLKIAQTLIINLYLLTHSTEQSPS
jgi:hypothetical protein